MKKIFALVMVLAGITLLTGMVAGDRDCSRCGGTGKIADNCSFCSGRGWRDCSLCYGHNQPCGQCGQTGIKEWNCPDCRGTGKVND